jgi:cation transport ATPase
LSTLSIALVSCVEEPLDFPFSSAFLISGTGYLYYRSSLVYIWWSAIQGIRERDFTADIPVSFATAAALIIGQYSAAAVVAVLLLLGGMLEEFVSARRQCPGLVGKAAPGPGGRQAWRRGPGGSPGGGAKR